MLAWIFIQAISGGDQNLVQALLFSRVLSSVPVVLLLVDGDRYLHQLMKHWRWTFMPVTLLIWTKIRPWVLPSQIITLAVTGQTLTIIHVYA